MPVGIEHLNSWLSSLRCSQRRTCSGDIVELLPSVHRFLADVCLKSTEILVPKIINQC